MTRIPALLLLLIPLGATAPAPTPKPQLRCGWIQNPTPGNWWLDDRDGTWIIGTQGLAQAEGMHRIPDLTTHDWVVTNGSSYGYGCGCMRVDVNRREQRIVHIHGVTQKPLSACRADPALRRPDS